MRQISIDELMEDTRRCKGGEITVYQYRGNKVQAHTFPFAGIKAEPDQERQIYLGIGDKGYYIDRTHLILKNSFPGPLQPITYFISIEDVELINLCLYH